MIRSMEEFASVFRAARSVSTPLVAVRTADPASTTRLITEAVQQHRPLPGVVAWDVMRGIRALTKDANDALAHALGNREPDAVGPADALLVARELAEDAVLIYANAHRFWNEPSVMQGIWNMRDAFKANGRMLVLLASPGATLPPELALDVLVLDEPLPSADHLEQIVTGTFHDAGLDEPYDPLRTKAVDALMGLAAFPAEQALAMSLVKGALDPEDLWERKRQIIEQTPGLTVWRGGETFDDLGGLENVKQFLNAALDGIDSPRVIVFIDEIEKAFAGIGTDLSGVKTEMAGTMLTWMQDHEADGLIFIGPPGAAKSAVGKATGNTAGIPTIAFDLTAMESSLVGPSGDRLRTALCRFSLATSERFKNKTGEVEEHTEWHSIVAWGKLAEICGEYVTRGKLCYVEGKIRSRKWQDKQGNERKSFEIVASQMRLLSSSNGNAAKSKVESARPAPQTGTSQNVTQPSQEDNPFEADSPDVPF